MSRPLVFVSYCWSCYDKGGPYRDVLDRVEDRFGERWDIWRDREQRAIGEPFRPEIDRVMRECHVALLMLSRPALERGEILRECHRLMPRLEVEPDIFRIVPVVFDGLEGKDLAKHRLFGATRVGELDLLSVGGPTLDPLLDGIEHALGDPDHYPASWHELRWVRAMLQATPADIDRPRVLGWLRTPYARSDTLGSELDRSIPRGTSNTSLLVTLLRMLWVPRESGRALRAMHAEARPRLAGVRLGYEELAEDYAQRAWLVDEAYAVVSDCPPPADPEDPPETTLAHVTVQLARELIFEELDLDYGTDDERVWLDRLDDADERARVAGRVNAALAGYARPTTRDGREVAPPKPVVLVLGAGHITHADGIELIRETYPSVFVFVLTDDEDHHEAQVLRQEQDLTRVLGGELIRPALDAGQQRAGRIWRRRLERKLTPRSPRGGRR